jgi:hypothetical protein
VLFEKRFHFAGTMSDSSSMDSIVFFALVVSLVGLIACDQAEAGTMGK